MTCHLSNYLLNRPRVFLHFPTSVLIRALTVVVTNHLHICRKNTTFGKMCLVGVTVNTVPLLESISVYYLYPYTCLAWIVLPLPVPLRHNQLIPTKRLTTGNHLFSCLTLSRCSPIFLTISLTCVFAEHGLPKPCPWRACSNSSRVGPQWLMSTGAPWDLLIQEVGKHYPTCHVPQFTPHEPVIANATLTPTESEPLSLLPAGLQHRGVFSTMRELRRDGDLFSEKLSSQSGPDTQ